MVDAATQTFILQVFDYQLDYNIKLITLGLILIYVIGLKIYASQLTLDRAYKAVIKAFSGLLFYPTIIMAPLFTLLLFRGYTAIELWTILFVFYSLIFAAIFFIWIIFGLEKILNMFGIKADWASWQENKLYPEDMKSNWEGLTK